MLIKHSKIPFFEIITIGLLPSFFKRIVYRWKGYNIGKHVSLGFGSVIIGKKVELGDNVKLGLLTVIRGTQICIERFASIGSFTIIDSGVIRIGEDARINEQVIIGGMRSPQSRLDLGKRTIVMEYSFLNTTMPVTIGDDTGIGGHCLLFTHGSWLNQLDGFPVTFEPINIGKNVWLPWRVFVMPGVTIGDNVVVGANSLISRSVGSNCLVAGSPAKVIKEGYPLEHTNNQKFLIFKSFLHDFKNFLRHNGVNINSIEENDKIYLTGKAGRKAFEILVLLQRMDKFDVLHRDSLFILNVKDFENNLPGRAQKSTMYIDIFNKARIGTSEVGEEFVRFVSRYGLRFTRKD